MPRRGATIVNPKLLEELAHHGHYSQMVWIERNIEARTPSGGVTRSWSPVYLAPAKVAADTGQEIRRADGTIVESGFIVDVARDDLDVTEKDRIVIAGSQLVLNIVRVMQSSADKRTRIHAERVT